MQTRFEVGRADLHRIQVLQRFHEFDEDPDLGIEFVASIVVFEVEDCIYVAKLPHSVSLEGSIDLTGVVGAPVNMNSLFPAFDEKLFSKSPEPLAPNVYRKLPNLSSYNTETDHEDDGAESFEAQLISREARTLEILNQSPHENVVKYYGCRVYGKRIVGLCLEKLEEHLLQRLDRLGMAFNVDKCMADVRSGIAHIHKLGLCHNDLNPMNVMFRENGCAVIIDFDSCQPIGEELTLKSGTEGWCAPNRKMSAVENDMDALRRLDAFIRTLTSSE